MAKNHSEFYLHHLDPKTGEVVSVAPGEDIPSGVEVTNPYVLGKADADESSDDEEAPRRGRARKAASES